MSTSVMTMQYRPCVWLLLVLCSIVTEQHDESSDGSLYVYGTKDSTLYNTGNTTVNITQDSTVYEIKDQTVQITKDPIILSTESSSVYSTEDSLEYSTGSAFPYITRNPTVFTESPTEHITGSLPVHSTAGQHVLNIGRTQDYGSLDATTSNSMDKSLHDREDQSAHRIRSSAVNSGWKSLNFHRNDQIARSIRNPLHYKFRHHPVQSTRKTPKKLRKRHPSRKSKSRKRSRKRTNVTGRPYTGVYVIPDMMCALCSRQKKRGRRRKCKMMFCHS